MSTLKKFVVFMSVLIVAAICFYYSKNNAERSSKTIKSDTSENVEADKGSMQVVAKPVMLSESVSKEKTTSQADMLIQDLVNENIDDMLFYDWGINDLTDYVSINEDNIQSILAEMDKEGAEKVSSEQLSELLNVASRDILGYKHGDPNMMLSNLLRTSYTFNEDVIDTAYRNKMLKYYGLQEDEIPQDAEGVLRLYLIMNSQRKANRKNLYNEISASASKLKFYTTSKPPESLRKQLHRLQDISMKILWDGFVSPLKFSVSYDNSPDEVARQNGKLLWVEARIVASDSQNKKYSRLKRYYWSPEDNTWLMMDWASLRARERLVDEIF